MESTTAEGRTAPYVSFTRFEGFIESLKGKVPGRIDRSVTSRMSGADRSAIKIANTFFSLIKGEDSTVTEALHRLVGARGTENWSAVLASIIEPAYAGIVGGLDTNATRQQLEQRFREAGNVTGDSLAKAVRFYLSAAAAAKVAVSPHFETGSPTPRASSGNGTTPRRAPQARKKRESVDSSSIEREKDDALPQGVRELRFPLPTKDVRLWLPDDVTDAELDFVWKYLRDYLSLKRGEPTK